MKSDSLWRRVPRGLAAGLVVLLLAGALAQDAQGQSQPSTPPPSAQQQPQPQPPEAGGPQGDVGPIAVPKKKEEAPPPPPPKPKKIEGMPDYTVRVDVPVVNVDVTVTTKKDGHFIPGLKKENFRVYEDGVPQTVTSFGQSEAPITAVLLVEFASTNYNFVYDMLNSAYTFASQLRPQDWIAVVSYDMRPDILVDFTQDKRAIYGALGQMRMPMFRETNLFDALYDTLDRIDRVEGHKYVILVASGVDTFSKKNLDQVLKKVQTTHDVTIYTISTGVLLRLQAEQYMSPEVNLTYLQADNQMHSFARMTGGVSFQPRFEAELPDVFRQINGTIRNQYSLAYHSTNTKQDGTYRKIKVELVDALNGGPINIRDEKGKEVKYNIIAREGYRAKQTVE